MKIPLRFLALLSLSGAGGGQEIGPLWRMFPNAARDHSSVVAADLTGDGVEDVALLAEGELCLVRGVAWYANSDGLVVPEEVAQGVLDIAVLPGAGADGCAALVGVGNDGLRIWRYAGEGQWEMVVSHGPPAFDHVASWAPVGGLLQIVATSPDGTVHAFEYDATSEDLEVLGVFSVGSTPFADVLLFNKDDDGVPEIALTRDSGLLFYTLGGAYLGTLMVYPFGSGALAAVLPTAERSHERLAIVTYELAAFPSTYWLRVLYDQAGALAVSAPVDIGAEVPLCLAVGDWDENGEPDLAVSDASRAVRVFESSGETFSSADVVDLFAGKPAVSPTSAIETMVLQDLDHDGDADGFFVDGSDSGGILYRSDATVSATWAPTLEEPAEPLPGYPSGGAYPLRYTLRMSTEASIPAEATDIEVVAWMANEDQQILSGHPESTVMAALPAASADLLLSIPAHDFDGTETTHDWVLETRYVRRMPDEPVHAYPARFCHLRATATWTASPQGGQSSFLTAPPGYPSLRGDFLPLDDIPPYEETPMNP
jgi:hypothetical protein